MALLLEAVDIDILLRTCQAESILTRPIEEVSKLVHCNIQLSLTGVFAFLLA